MRFCAQYCDFISEKTCEIRQILFYHSQGNYSAGFV